MKHGTYLRLNNSRTHTITTQRLHHIILSITITIIYYILLLHPHTYIHCACHYNSSKQKHSLHIYHYLLTHPPPYTSPPTNHHQYQPPHTINSSSTNRTTIIHILPTTLHHAAPKTLHVTPHTLRPLLSFLLLSGYTIMPYDVFKNIFCNALPISNLYSTII